MGDYSSFFKPRAVLVMVLDDFKKFPNVFEVLTGTYDKLIRSTQAIKNLKKRLNNGLNPHLKALNDEL